MKIAVTYENEMVFQHFGHTEKFKIYEVENDNIVSMKIVDTNGKGHGALATFLKENGVDTVICGGIGGGAKNQYLNDLTDEFCLKKVIALPIEATAIGNLYTQIRRK